MTKEDKPLKPKKERRSFAEQHKPKPQHTLEEYIKFLRDKGMPVDQIIQMPSEGKDPLLMVYFDTYIESASTSRYGTGGSGREVYSNQHISNLGLGLKLPELDDARHILSNLETSTLLLSASTLDKAIAQHELAHAMAVASHADQIQTETAHGGKAGFRHRRWHDHGKDGPKKN